jgi:hypothetical protein
MGSPIIIHHSSFIIIFFFIIATIMIIIKQRRLLELAHKFVRLVLVVVLVVIAFTVHAEIISAASFPLSLGADVARFLYLKGSAIAS